MSIPFPTFPPFYVSKEIKIDEIVKACFLFFSPFLAPTSFSFATPLEEPDPSDQSHSCHPLLPLLLLLPLVWQGRQVRYLIE